MSPQELNTKAWNLAIKSHIYYGRADEAMVLYKRMRELGVEHDGFTFPIINKAVLLINSGLVLSSIIHCVAFKMGFGSDLYFCNTLIEVYGKWGQNPEARKLFETMPVRDIVSWTSIISMYICDGRIIEAFDLFKKMWVVIEPNFVTLLVLLQGCSALELLFEGRQVHGFIIKDGLLADASVQNSVLRMYSKAGGFAETENFFNDINPRDIFSWNILISFYFSHGDIKGVIDSFKNLNSDAMIGVETLTITISAFAKHGNYVEGKQLHSYVTKSGLFDDAIQTSLLNFYSKCNDFESLSRLFGEIPRMNTIHKSAMASGLVQNGYFAEAIAFFTQFKDTSFSIDVLRPLVDAYANLGALRSGKSAHGYFIRNLSREEDDLQTKTSILNMYVKCGSLSSARKYFRSIFPKDVVTWTSMMEGYAIHGLGMEALRLFQEMVMRGTEPNSVTFLSLLSACSHSGLVKQGCEVFHLMKWLYGIEPELTHFTCLVDLLARSGKLKEALMVTVKMVSGHDVQIWRALLAGSCIHGDRRIAAFAADKVLEIEPGNVGCYVLVGNVEAGNEKWNEAEKVRMEMNGNNMIKNPAWSSVEAVKMTEIVV